ncbi:hypothetical protein SAMN04487785_11412 [Dyella jiangningensis]|uniref:hypothetical protein n=1 Tax=Dyella sp. AtDHG13 TaxID=1938897 RepID=UPI000891A73A|nr:hypothetical protein [Dyella sp. AtDHG13]PXV54208.1 hypothetical protein BDW41_113161 [Dyella sp. AtDHG13]SDL03984.1 hypothetical protein SAMN04487785_11412 [Dyella jiangningensis]
MTRCHHCHCRLTEDEVMYYEFRCARCEDKVVRRYDNRYFVGPYRAGNILFCLIGAGIFVAFMYCMWRSVGGWR